MISHKMVRESEITYIQRLLSWDIHIHRYNILQPVIKLGTRNLLRALLRQAYARRVHEFILFYLLQISL